MKGYINGLPTFYTAHCRLNPCSAPVGWRVDYEDSSCYVCCFHETSFKLVSLVQSITKRGGLNGEPKIELHGHSFSFSCISINVLSLLERKLLLLH